MPAIRARRGRWCRPACVLERGDYEGADAFAEALKYLPDYPPALVGRARGTESSSGGECRERLEKVPIPLVETAWLLGAKRWGDAMLPVATIAPLRRAAERIA
jgi:hypothetical protein